MSNFLGPLAALIGVVVGVVTTGWADRASWKRGQVVRWDERRVDAYAEYAKAIKKMHITALRLVDPRLAGDNPAEPINRKVGLETLAQAEVHRGECWELILLLGDQATAHAGLGWHTLVSNEAKFARSRPDDAESDDWIALVRSADQARDHFYDAARKSVNVGGGSVAIAQLLPAAERTRTDGEQPTVPADL
jgi:hypothetical protein